MQFCYCDCVVCWSSCDGIHDVWGLSSIPVYSKLANRFSCLQDCFLDHGKWNLINRILSLIQPFVHVMTLLLQIVNPFTKYALTMAPVAMSLEELIPSNHTKSHMYSILIRTALVMSTLFVALKIPFFGKLNLSILPEQTLCSCPQKDINLIYWLSCSICDGVDRIIFHHARCESFIPVPCFRYIVRFSVSIYRLVLIYDLFLYSRHWFYLVLASWEFWREK